MEFVWDVYDAVQTRFSFSCHQKEHSNEKDHYNASRTIGMAINRYRRTMEAHSRESFDVGFSEDMIK